MSTIYQEIILELYRNPHNAGTIKNPSKQTVSYNPSCGDRIEMDILFVKNNIKDIKYRGSGCAISQASASLLTDYIKNKSKDDLKKLDKEFMMKLLGIELGPNRVKCAVLSLEALHKLLV